MPTFVHISSPTKKSVDYLPFLKNSGYKAEQKFKTT